MHNLGVRVLLAGLAAASLPLAGCSQDEAPPSSSPAGSSAPAAPSEQVLEGAVSRGIVIDGHRAHYLGALTEEVDFPSAGFAFAPPREDAEDDWTAAFKTCFESDLRCVVNGDADVALADVSGPTGSAPDDVHGGRLFDHELAYVITWEPSRANCQYAPGLNRTVATGPGCRITQIVPVEVMEPLYVWTMQPGEPVVGEP